MRLGLAVVPRLPRRCVLWMAQVLGTVGYAASARLRRTGMANLDVAFGETKTEAEKRRILKRSLQTIALTMLDLLWFVRDSAGRMERWFVAGRGLADDAVDGDRPRVGVTGHFGNWELMGRYWAHRFGSMMSVAMPIKNECVDEIMQDARGVTGQQIVARDGALRKLIRHLRGGGTVGLLLDQNSSPSEGGIFVDFFGKPASVSPAAGILASRTGAEVIFAYALPQPDGTYVGEVPHRITAEEIAAMPREELAVELTRRITKFYEEAIRAHPECWLWSYKRWRYIPEGVAEEGFPYYSHRFTPAKPPGSAK